MKHKSETSEIQKEEFKLTDLPGVGDATAEKLIESGYDSLMAIAVATPSELVELVGMGDAVAKKLINIARNKVDMGFESGEDLLKRREQIIKITTGVKAFNDLMGGGFETGCITECFGEFGASKSQIAHAMAINVQLPKDQGGAEGMAVFIDGEGTFRPERIQQMAIGAGLDPAEALRNIKVARAFNSDHQMLLAEKVEDLITKEKLPIKLVIIDSLTAHFRAEFCVTPETQVIGNPKACQIQDYNPGDKVLTHTGEFKNILSKQVLDYNGEILKINPKYGMQFSITGDHEVLAMKCIRKTYYRKGSNHKRKIDESYILKKDIGKNHYKIIEGYGPAWIKSDNLEKGDYLVYPVVKQIKDIEKLFLADYVKGKYVLQGEKIKCTDFYHDKEIYKKVIEEYSKSDKKKGTRTAISKKYKIPVSTVSQWLNKKQRTREDIVLVNNEIKVDKKFMRLLGYYLAEGSGVGNHQIRLTFDTKEKEYHKDVKKLIKEVFGVNTNKDVIIGNSTNIAVSTRLIMDFLKSLVGGNAKEKKLPPWVLYLPKDKQKELVRGYWSGDGCKSEYGFQIDTASIVLAEQMKLIFGRLGFIPSIRKVEGGKRKNPKYVVSVFGEKLKDFCDIVGQDHKIIHKRKYSYNHGWNDGNYLFVPINKIIKEGYNGKLYSLEVEDNHSYAINYAVLHNCGRGTLADRQQKLNKHMHVLSKLAAMYNICIYVTNQVMAKPDTFFGDPTTAIGGNIVGHNSTFRIYLRKGKKGTRVAKLVDAPALPDGEAVFMVTEEGLREAK